VIEHGDLCVRLVDELAIEVNLHRRGGLECVGKIVEPEPEFLLVRELGRTLFVSSAIPL
jgi:hypothetical protein